MLCAPAFRRLGAWAVLIGVANICQRAWRKRLRPANEWLVWLCGELIASPGEPDWVLQRQAGRVLLVDATCIRQVGGTGDDWRLHPAYDLRAGRLCQVSLTDRHGGEELSYYQLQPGDIVIADRGYGFRCSVALASQQQAYVLLRFGLKSFPVEDEEGGAIALLAWAEQTKLQVASYPCWYRWAGQRGQVRLIIRRLSEEQAKAARERMQQAAKKKGKTVSERALRAAGWVWLVTNLPADIWHEQDILRVYRARWQIELVYKRLKQLLRLGQVQCQRRARVEATICLGLIAWALQEQEAAQIRTPLATVATGEAPQEDGVVPPAASHDELQDCEEGLQDKDVQPLVDEISLQAGESALESPASHEPDAGPISTWLLTSRCLDLLTQQVRGYWSAGRLRECLPALRRLWGRRRRREQQETLLREWLSCPLHSLARLPIQLLACSP